MPIGFVGTGAITTAIVTGLSTEGGPRPVIRLSPRNAARASDLASRFDNVSVCVSNQEVLDSSETVVLAVRPQVAEEVVLDLKFPPGQNVISIVAGFPTRRLASMGVPGDRVWRAIPLPSIAQRRSPTAVYPPGGPATQLFGSLGRVFEIRMEDHLNAFSTATSTMAAYFGFIGHIAAWVARKGVPEKQAREYMAMMFAGLTDAGLERSERSFEDLAEAHATPGGLNAQVLRDLTDHGVFETLNNALDSVHRRATGQSV
ncbi:MAG TPA: pyrroline-5-carboxylate reductase [Bryobacteraceae bacterium]|nr:pyrroline-5-carboxylate reductase [Bryobacteraceae bacterium]